MNGSSIPQVREARARDSDEFQWVRPQLDGRTTNATFNMKNRILPPEVVSLIHHVELNRTGWWRKAVGQVVRGLLWKVGKPVSPVEIQDAFRAELGFTVPLETIEKQLASLQTTHVVSPFPPGRHKLTEKASAEFKASMDRAEDEVTASKTLFVNAVAEKCPDLEAEYVWHQFSAVLTQAVQVIGANTFHLLADGRLERESDWLGDFLEHFPEHQDPLRLVLATFFAPENKSCRSLILRLMSAHFFAEAAQLPESTIASIEAKRKQRTLRVVLDTNFVFSILGLHDHPADEAVTSLLDIARSNHRYLDVRFFVLPHTLEEAKRSLIAKQHEVENVRVTRAIYRASRQSPVSSIAAKYFAVAQNNSTLTATEYFRPYIEDLRTILQEKGINVLDAPAAIWNTNQQVIDDLNDELAREQSYPEAKRKGYEVLLHDMVLWHVVQSRRGSETVSPLDADWWVVSIDWRFIGFDQRKRHALSQEVPVVLYPTHLVQLLQFWMPRSDDLDKSLVDSLRLPLFFHQFDPDDERATIKILEVLSRYENADDLADSTVQRILANQALRTRIKEADEDNENVVQLVREELIEENKRTQEMLAKANQALGMTTAAAEHVMTQYEAERTARVAAETSVDALAAQLKAQQALTAKSTTDLAVQAEETNKLKGIVDRLQAQVSRRSFVTMKLGLPALLAACLAYGVWFFWPSLVSDGSVVRRLVATAGVGILAIAGVLWLAARHVDRSPDLSEWWLGRVIRGVYRWIFALGAVLSGVVPNALWDGFKKLVDIP